MSLDIKDKVSYLSADYSLKYYIILLISKDHKVIIFLLSSGGHVATTQRKKDIIRFFFCQDTTKIWGQLLGRFDLNQS